MSRKTPHVNQPTSAQARAERQADALRANLHKRKAQDRARKSAEIGDDADGIRQEKGEEWTES